MPTSHTIQHHFSTPWPAKHVDPIFVQEQAFRFMRDLALEHPDQLRLLPQLHIAVFTPSRQLSAAPDPVFEITFRLDGPLTPDQIRLIIRSLDERYRRFAPAFPANSSDH